MEILGLDEKRGEVIRASHEAGELIAKSLPSGVSYILITFQAPVSFGRPAVSLFTPADKPTVERLLSGILEKIRSRIIV